MNTELKQTGMLLDDAPSSAGRLRNQHSRSFGVKMLEAKVRKLGQFRPLHGMSQTLAYRSWAAMRTRCLNRNNDAWDRYGGRGITICARWSCFLNFLADMGPRPSKDYSIDRINPNGNYEPENCRWATRQEQQNNRKDARMITWNGKTQCITAWEKELGLPPNFLCWRIFIGGWSIEKAFTWPSRYSTKHK
jgi:hypothetical protein